MNEMFDETTIEVAKKISKLGGRLYLVGGAVRDLFLDRSSHDHDYVVTGITTTSFEENFGNPPKTGALFPVYRIIIGNEECEIAFARKEIKTCEGHNGFSMVFDPSITIEEDLIRRDTTVNAIAIDILSGEMVDPFHGVDDIRQGVMRAVSSHFSEDPLRVLRVARQATQFNFSVDANTLKLMKDCSEELAKVPYERVWKELEKALSCSKPSTFFRVLVESNTLGCNFPELEALIGQEQPVEYHPEGDAFEHSMMVLDSVASATESLEARFCALFHDIGKGVTPVELLPKHHHHDRIGAEMVVSWENGRFPAKFKKSVATVCRHHMVALHLDEMKSSKVFDLMESVKKGTSFSTFRAVVKADSHKDFKILSDASVKEVFGKVEIPKVLLEAGDGARIRDYVRQVRIQRVREIRGLGK